MPPLLDSFADELAVWVEDRRSRAPSPFRPAPAEPLGCFGPLPPLPPPPPRRGAWRAASPLPIGGDAFMAAVAAPARSAPRGTAILVPPWKAESGAAVRVLARIARDAGFDVWTAVPPRHGPRARPGVRSGEGFLSPDLGAVRSALEQLVVELRVLAALARARGGETALVGVSLGALGAALAATAPEAVDLAALVVPPVDLAAIFSATRLGRRYARLAALAGAPVPGPDVLGPMLAPLRPDSRRPTAGRTFVAVARDDRIAPQEGGLALARAWEAEARVYPRGHFTLVFACRAFRRDLARFLAPA